MERKNILVVDDDRIIRDSLCDFLSVEGFGARGTNSLKGAVGELRKRSYALVITEINLSDGNGFDLLDIVHKEYPQTVVVVITGYGTIESAVRAIKRGAYDYLTKPIIDDELRLAVDRAINQHSLMSENEKLKLQLENRYSLENIISHDYKMARIFDLVEAVADSGSTILMTGPSGTGKSMLARAIHYRSSRRDKPFVEVSCGAIPESLLESELFGHAKGSFTGAISDKVGKFLAADEGTIFLDEISNASYALQVKLLRVLQDRQFEAVGSNKTLKVNTRVITATNLDIAKEVTQGSFRKDLYYRINVVTIDLPPLCERVGDVPLLANRFLRIYSTQHNREKVGINPQAMVYLERYCWPGNVRELENVIERAVLLSKGKYIGIEDLPISVRTDEGSQQSLYEQMDLKDSVEQSEKRIIQQALEVNQWSRQKTAKSLGINRTTLFKKMKRYGLYDQARRLGLI